MDNSTLVEAAHSFNFLVQRLAEKPKNMFGEFNEASKPKTSLVKYSIEFNDLAVQMRPHRIAYLRRSVGRLKK